MSLLSLFLEQLQRSLFVKLADEFGPLSEVEQQVLKTLELVRIEEYVSRVAGRWVGRPEKDRRAIARAFVVKAVMGVPTTRDLVERLRSQATLRCLCGWETRAAVPSEATFSRAFSEFARTELVQRVHEAIIEQYEKPRLVGHISRDTTAIRVREKAVAKARQVNPPQRRGKGQHRRRRNARPAKVPTRLQRQAAGMDLSAMIEELPRLCDWGCKRNGEGKTEHWKGYKLHLDWADGGIPISGLLTSASMHDSQAAIPLATMTAQRVTSLYDLMDASYDASEIRDHSRALGHVPLIERNQRNKKAPVPLLDPAETKRCRERTTAERGNSRIHDQFGARTIRVRGAAKVMTHLMFGILALTADQLLRLTG